MIQRSSFAHHTTANTITSDTGLSPPPPSYQPFSSPPPYHAFTPRSSLSITHPPSPLPAQRHVHWAPTAIARCLISGAPCHPHEQDSKSWRAHQCTLIRERNIFLAVPWSQANNCWKHVDNSETSSKSTKAPHSEDTTPMGGDGGGMSTANEAEDKVGDEEAAVAAALRLARQQEYDGLLARNILQATRNRMILEQATKSALGVDGAMDGRTYVQWRLRLL